MELKSFTWSIGIGIGAIGSSAKASESNMSFASGEGGKSDKKIEGSKDKTEVVEKEVMVIVF